MQQPRESKENVEQRKGRCRIHECSFQCAATEKEEAETNPRDLTDVEKNEKMLLETPAAEDLEILKLVALFSQNLISSKNASNLSRSLPVSSARSIALPPPVIFRRRKLASLNCPAECKK
jgi:hypothetical protein